METTEAERPGLRGRLQAALAPPAPTGLAPLTGAVFCLGFLVAILRVGFDLGGPRLWAEDGLIFVYQGATDSPTAALSTTYAGYLHVAPRLVVEALRLLPMGDVAIGVVVVCALVQALAAAVTVQVLSGLGGRRWLVVTPAAAVCAVPVGTEVILNLANLQWFLLYLASILLLWRPRTAVGTLLQWTVLVVTTLSSPFGVIPVALCLFRALVLRTRPAAALFVVSALTTAVQLAVMVGGRSVRPEPAAIRTSSYGASYLRRVLADGLLGIGRLEDDAHSPEVTTGVVLLLVFLVLAAVGVQRHGADVAIRLGVLMALSVATYVIPMVIVGGTGLDAIYQGRYAVAPALLWLCALCLAGSAAAGRDAVGLVAGAVAVALAAGGVFGMVTSYGVQPLGREVDSTWRSQVNRNEQACATANPNEARAFATPPGPAFDFTLSCRQIADW